MAESTAASVVAPSALGQGSSLTSKVFLEPGKTLIDPYIVLSESVSPSAEASDASAIEMVVDGLIGDESRFHPSASQDVIASSLMGRVRL